MNLKPTDQTTYNNDVSERSYPDRIEVDENIFKLSQQKEARSHALSSWYCICTTTINHFNAMWRIVNMQHFGNVITVAETAALESFAIIVENNKMF